VTPVQRDVYILIDEYWKEYGHGPTMKELAYLRGRVGIGNTHRILVALAEMGAIQRFGGRWRSAKPKYVRYQNIE